MPYIIQEQRTALNPSILDLQNEITLQAANIHSLVGKSPSETLPGLLNYAITTMIYGLVDGKESYALYNAMIGALESAKLELYRKKVAPYEDQKEFENGEVKCL